MEIIQSNYRKVVDDASKAYETIRNLESKLAKVEADAQEKFKDDKTVEALQTKINEHFQIKKSKCSSKSKFQQKQKIPALVGDPGSNKTLLKLLDQTFFFH